MKLKKKNNDPVNSNEIMSDYHFYFQLIKEERKLDIEHFKQLDQDSA